MEDFIQSLLNIEISLSSLIAMISISSFIAIFYTIILSGLYQIKFKSWLFFILNPALIFIAFLLFNSISTIVLLIQFALVFPLAFIGIIYDSFSTKKQENLELDALNLKFKNGKTKEKTYLLGGLLSIMMLIFFPIIIFVVIAKKIHQNFYPNTIKRFLNLQKFMVDYDFRSNNLGTAKINGKIKMIDPIIAPIDNLKCVGYFYLIERFYSDSEGDRISNFFDDKKCNPFYIENDKGKVLVKPEKLSFLWLDLNKQYLKDHKRYNQYLLQNNDEVTIIGNISVENGIKFLEFDQSNNLYIISTLKSISNYFENKGFIYKWLDDLV